MRKITFLSLILMTVIGLKGQIIFQEDFQAGIPSNFILINNDGKTPASTVNYVNQAWVAHADFNNTADTCAISTSWYSPAGTSDDWMILPKQTLTTGNFLIWRGWAPDQNYPDGYEVKISTTDSAMSSFTTNLTTISAEGDPWVWHAVDLSSYNNQDVWVAFRNNSNDKFLLFIDDIMIRSVDSFDIAGISNTMQTPIGLNNAPFDVKGTIANKGSQTITFFNLNYSINGGTPVTAAITGVNISTLNNYSFTHPTKWTPTAVGTYEVKIWASDINGNHVDADNTNDTITATISVSSQSTQRIPLYETFTSSTCGPCVSGNQNMDGLFAANPNKWVCIKYQMSWPGSGDPYYTTEGNVRRNFYGVNSVPRQEIDGGYDGNSSSVTQADFNAAYAIPSFVEMDAYMIIDTVAHQFTVGVNVNPLVNLPSSARLFVGVVEKTTYNNTGSNGETEFHWVMKKMMPNASGTAVTAVAGTPFSKYFNYTFPGNYRLPPNASSPINVNTEHSVEEFSDLTAVCWIQNMSTKEVYQSCYSSITLGVADNHPEKLITKVYPNPASDKVNINMDLPASSKVSLEIVTPTGQSIKKIDFGTQIKGNQTLTVDVSQFESGIYFFRFKIGETLYMKPIIVK